MSRKPRLFRATLVLALGATLWSAACSEQGNAVLAPEQSELARGEDAKAKQKEPKVKVHGRHGRDLPYTLAIGDASDVSETQAQAVFTQGRRLRIDLPGTGHYLVIPGDALDGRTLDGNRATFKIKASKRTALTPASGERQVYVAVELKASALINGIEVDLGEQGFTTDVDLYLSSRWANNVSSQNLPRLEIIWEHGNSFAAVECWSPLGKNAANPCVESSGWTVHARLKHFSNYALGFPD